VFEEPSTLKKKEKKEKKKNVKVGAA